MQVQTQQSWLKKVVYNLKLLFPCLIVNHHHFRVSWVCFQLVRRKRSARHGGSITLLDSFIRSVRSGMTMNHLNLDQEARIAIASKHALLEAKGTLSTLGHQALHLVQVSLLLGKTYIKPDEKVLQMASILCKASSRILDLYNDRSEWPPESTGNQTAQPKKCPEKLVSSKGDETSAKRWDQWCFLFSGFVVAQTHQREEPGLTRWNFVAHKGSIETNIVEPKR